jgi:antitoxin (DNA-binding transcriptional repressor) of toxin-antitoxin stability system
MRQVDIHEAETQLSKWISTGEEIIIVRDSEPVARLVPVKPPAAKRVPGSVRGKFTVPAEFFEPLPTDLLDAFEP